MVLDFYNAIQNGMQFKTYDLFVGFLSNIFVPLLTMGNLKLRDKGVLLQ